MNLDRLKNKRICFLGFGIENQALLKFLLKNKVKADITVCDARTITPSLRSFPSSRNTAGVGVREWRLGKNYDKDLEKYDIIFRIAGYPLFAKNIIKAMIKGVEIRSATKLFFDLCPTKNIIGVTGTKGKGTTASLIYAILKSAFAKAAADKDAKRKIYFGGNIGTPMFSFFDKIKTNDWVVLELSSFQLEDLRRSPRVAVFTNFFPDHLAAADPLNPNYHKNLITYWDAKANIFSHQSPRNILIANKILCPEIERKRPRGKVIYFDKSNLKTPLIGEHNKRNIAAAALAAQAAGVSQKIIAAAVKKFKGLEHRLEFVAAKNDARYYNDSFSTAPDTAIIAIAAFRSHAIILIAGGSDKGSDFSALAGEIKKSVKYLILLPGKGTEKIKRALKKIKYQNIGLAGNMAQAVERAKKMSMAGDIILLSPACASFGIFKNYKDRGAQFKKFTKLL
ncbi:UDP-N-acetylmuramoyl-L-alanine--D-glutamate ligase [Candidatus Falkowbacteria bacterium CG10_big_fil_rev_8_21_14_0_10_43_11]|uniref:UDP-N-acetylmuramoylalanine--D-glutamate ligase n=1 Tax=Candidatus Falkowbacteria bacterium CG10_big_fil_rev_8_21_14_0_10_43_11 TaxID=1974568 RepID=A0A2M6WLL4_9BACT|nr:MAG: UDP-N-acetylmuramoyl-L-alanine--D-glutamate ligase [Candidatus Falkowbacteria bacterium CG10_big_fil_rev_8_21_14_0_10_43_11]